MKCCTTSRTRGPIVSCTSNPPSPDDLELLSHVLREVARSRRLSPEDAQDFIQTAQMKLLERNYDIFCRFSGRSSLRTYLTVVVTRLLLDWRNSVYGKWRASAAAVTLGRCGGPTGAARRVRDGYTMDEAIGVVLGGRNAPARGRARADRGTAAATALPAPRVGRVAGRGRRGVRGSGGSTRRRGGWPIDGFARRWCRALRRLPAEDRWLIRRCPLR